MKFLSLLAVLILSSVTIFANQTEWVFEVNPRNVKMFSSDKLERPLWFLETYKSSNMVNLSFFNHRTYIGPYKDRRVSSYNSPKNWPFLVIEKGEAYIYDAKGWKQNGNPKMIGVTAEYVAAGFPVLIQDGKKTKISKSFFSRRRCARTAVGIHPNGSLIIYVTKRATLKELQSYLSTMGCTDAINFDGGSSTFLYLDGKKVYSSNEGRSYPNVLYWD